jgi:hypothetical protein
MSPSITASFWGCRPVCASTELAQFIETDEPWPTSPGEATHAVWDGMEQETRLRRIRVALGLHRREAQPTLAHAKERFRQVIADCASALLDGQSVEWCRSMALAGIDAARRETVDRVDEYSAGPLAPANARWVLLTKLDGLCRNAQRELERLLSSQR